MTSSVTVKPSISHIETHFNPKLQFMEREEIVSQILSRTEFGLNVFIHYLGEGCKKKNFRNPYREDSRASCRLYYNSARGVSRYFMQDFGDSTWCGDCFAIVGRIVNLDCRTQFRDILRTIDEELNLSLYNNRDECHPFPTRKPLPPYPSTNRNETAIITFDAKERGFTDSELDYWESYGISEEILKRYNVCSLESLQMHKESGETFTSHSTANEPMFGYKFVDKGIKVYRPMSRNRFFYAGVLPKPYVFGLEQLPSMGSFVYITGGEKDVMSLAAHGFNAICFNSETAKFPKSVLIDLSKRFSYVFILYDSDETGRKESELRLDENSEFDNLYKVTLPLEGTKQAKDVSDFFSSGGTAYRLFKLSLQAEKSCKSIATNKLRGFIKGKVKSYSHNIPIKLQDSLNSIGIYTQYINVHLRSCIVNVFGRDYAVLCMKNDSESPVIYSPLLAKVPLTVGKSNITTIQGCQRGIYRSCIVFENYLDYLAFLSSDLCTQDLKNSDTMIMGDYKSLPKLLFMCQTYDKVFTCFPNTEYGKIIKSTIHHCSDGHGISLEESYEDFPSIKEYNLSK